MKKVNLTLIMSIILLYGCDLETNLDIDNVNDPDYNQAVTNASDLASILKGAHLSLFNIDYSATGTGFLLMSDQLTTTNNSGGYWQFAHQPRLQYTNTTSASVVNGAASTWNRAYDAIRGANHIIRWIEGEGKEFVIDGEDKSDEALASAYLVRGAAEGALARVYDKAYLVNWDSTTEELLQQRDANEVTASSLANYDKAISIVNSASSSFNNTYFLDVAMDKSMFSQYINSYAARTLISSARTKSEAANLDYNKILSYANNGFTSDFWYTVENWQTWYPYVMYDACYRYGAGHAYLQVDVKVMDLIDPNYLFTRGPNPGKDYPVEIIGTADQFLAPPVTSDSRYEFYFEYANTFGFLNAARDGKLFSNFRTRRFDTSGINSQWVAGFQAPVFLKAELDYIKAEATLKTQGPAAAAAILNASPRNTVGGITTGTSYAEVLKALHYEYAVELHLAGSSYLQWAFMKRNDLLQEGTPTMMPIPASELEAVGIAETYTFGGINAIGSAGTASTKGWKDDASYNE